MIRPHHVITTPFLIKFACQQYKYFSILTLDLMKGSNPFLPPPRVLTFVKLFMLKSNSIRHWVNTSTVMLILLHRIMAPPNLSLSEALLSAAIHTDRHRQTKFQRINTKLQLVYKIVSRRRQYNENSRTKIIMKSRYTAPYVHQKEGCLDVLYVDTIREALNRPVVSPALCHDTLQRPSFFSVDSFLRASLLLANFSLAIFSCL